ncbi:MAG: KEOPS complex subunit Pcc1 [Thermoproteota archaeon]|jgi:hypothetical protein
MIEKIYFKLNYKFRSNKEASIYYNSLLPEFEKGFPGVDISKILIEDDQVKIEIETKTLARGRAIFNSINRWLISMEDVSNKLEVR